MRHRVGLTVGADPVNSAWTLGWPTKRISIALTVMALVLWSYSIAQARFHIGYYGLIGALPVTYFVSLGIMTIASAILWVSRENEWGLMFLQLCFLVASIWLAPVIVGGAQPFLSDAYGDLGYIEYITRTDHVSQRAVWQHNWPVAWILWATGIKVSGASMGSFRGLITWIPFIWQCIIFFPMLVFFRNTIGKANTNYCWGALWIFYLGFWFESQNTGGQAFGVFFVFGILALLTMTPYWQQRATTVGHRLSAVILVAVSAVAHLLGSVFGLAIAGMLCVSRRMRSSNLVILAGLFIVAWSIYGAAVYFELNLPDWVQQVFRLDEATSRGILNPLSGNAAHAAVAKIRILFSALLVVIAGLAALLTWRLRRITYGDITVAAVAVGCAIAAAVIGGGYVHELYQRVFVFLLPVMAYSGAKLLHVKTTAVALCLLLVIALPFAFIAKYGNQTVDYISRGYLAGAEFFHDNTSGGYVAGGTFIGSMKNYERYGKDRSYGALEWRGDELLRFGSLESLDAAPRYVCIGVNDRAMLDYFYNEPDVLSQVESAMNSATNCSLVYANPDLEVFISERQG